MLPKPEYDSPRAHPRLSLATPLQVKVDNRFWVWSTIDVSLGGIGANYQTKPRVSTSLSLRFNLPNGSSISANGIVRYVHSQRVGVQFSDLGMECRIALEQYLQTAWSRTRSGGRISKRLYVTLAPENACAEEQVAETVILSRKGGLLICRAAFQIGDQLRLFWPSKNRTASIAVVFRRECGVGNLVELGFQILDDNNFWRMKFPSA